MLTKQQQQVLYDAGVIADCFGQKLSVGDYVLCKSYSCPDKDQVSQILKVNRKTVKLRVNRRTNSYGPYRPRPAGHMGKWNCYPNFQVNYSEIEINRNPFAVMKISSAFKAQLELTSNELLLEHPELFI